MTNSLSRLFGKGDLWQKSNGSVVGIDIGHSSVKAVQLRAEGGQAILETYGEIATGPYVGLAIGQAANLSSEKMSELLRDLLEEANITARLVSLSVPLRSSLLVIIELPKVSEDKINNVIKIEARKYIPVPISEVELDWFVIPKLAEVSSARDKTEVLLAAIHKDILKQFRENLRPLHLSPAFFEIETFSAIRAVITKERGPTVIIDFGASTTKLTIIDAGIVQASHTINKGAQDITLAISRSLGIEFAKAEEIKRSAGLVEHFQGQKLSSMVNAIIEFTFSEAEKVVTAYQTKRHRSIEKVVMIGGGALLSGLVEITSQSFKVPVIIGHPFAKLQFPAFLEETLEKTGPGFSVAIGLALRHLQSLE